MLTVDKSTSFIPDPSNAEPLKFSTWDKFIFCKDSQPENASSPIVSTFDKSICSKDEHALNAPSSIVSTFDKATVTNLQQPANACVGSDLIFALNVTSVILLASRNAFDSMLTTCDKSIVCNAAHPRKAICPIVVSDSDMITVSSSEHA